MKEKREREEVNNEKEKHVKIERKKKGKIWKFNVDRMRMKNQKQ